ncbi:MAG: TetR/AcrR family transcriptional regulator [Rhodospirillales bacterium]|nr:MAG: TetR/AcrR family transcriptional regulator [Rhodospirillales bacterium]
MIPETDSRGAQIGEEDGVGPAQAAGPRKRKRLPRNEREQMIVEEAIRFFAEVGFEGQTRELARRLGITQPLIFRYFPTKEDLIERVYQEVYLSRWDPRWEELLEDRDLPLGKRLTEFYKAYTKAIFTYEWVRIFVYSGLKGVNINKRYLALIRDRVFKRVMTELRAAHGLPSPDDVPFSEAELELAWGLHGSIFYIAIRKWIYEVEIPSDIEGVIAAEVENFVLGAPAVVERMISVRG